MIYINENVSDYNNYSLIGKNPSKIEKYSDDEKKTAKDLFKKKVQQGLLYHDYNLRNHPVCRCEVGRDIDRAVKFPCRRYSDLHCVDSYYIDNLKILNKINEYVQENNLHMTLIILQTYHHNKNYWDINQSDYDLKRLYATTWQAFQHFIKSPYNVAYTELKKKIGYKYSIFNFECCYSEYSSWNPHRNILIISERPLLNNDLEEIEEGLNAFWYQSIKRDITFATANKYYNRDNQEDIKEDIDLFHVVRWSKNETEYYLNEGHYKGVYVINNFKNIFYIADRNKLYQGFNGLRDMKNKRYPVNFSYAPYALGCQQKTQHLYREFLDLPVKLTIDEKIATKEAVFTYNDNLLDVVYSQEELKAKEQKKQDDKLIKDIRKRLKVKRVIDMYDLEFLTYIFEIKHFTPQILADKLSTRTDDEVNAYISPLYDEFLPVFDNYRLELKVLEEGNNFQLPSIKHRNKYFRHYLNHWYPFKEQ